MNITNIAFSAYLAFGQPVPNTREVVRYPGLQVMHADGTLTLRMTEPTRRETVEPGARHVIFESRDEHYPFALTRHVLFWEDCDVVETWVEIRHDEEGPVRLLKMDSFAAEIPEARSPVKVLTLAGANQQEAKVVESELAEGQTLATSSREGIHNAWESNPVMMVSCGEATEQTGEVLGVALEWTGCSAKSVRREADGRTKVFIGVDNQGGPYVLDPGRVLVTPRAQLVLSHRGKGEVSRQFHRWAHRHLMPHGYDLHPVLLNSWEGSYFSFTEKTLTDMMDGVCEMGGEMFVLDDGWFGRGKYARDEVNRDTSGLGDWFVNEKKLPHGLGWLSDQAKARGLKFGLWVEPEMVNTNSALCATHPDWMLQEPRRRLVLGRGKSQNTLDLCNPAVRENLFAQLDVVYSGIPDLAYVKWDANGPISNLGSPYLPRYRQGNLWFDYTMGLYDLLARFQAKRPWIMTQACASGGGHMDFGFLRYADEFWTSDRTDPVSRVMIQWGASQFYPASAMACHVTASPNHQTKRETPLKYRFDVAMSGRLGFELHPKDLTAEELAYAKERVAQYKRIRPIVQRGDLYRLASPYEHPYAALMYVSEDKARAVVFALGLDRPLDEKVILRLDGLDPSQTYVVEGERRTGLDLMQNGLGIELKGVYASQVIELSSEIGDVALEIRPKRSLDGLVCDDFLSDGCGGVAGWNPLPEPNVLSERRFAILPERTAEGRRILRITGSKFLRMEAGTAQLVPGGKYRLAIQARTKGLGNQGRLQYLLYGYDGWSKDWALNLPKDTNGRWQEISKEFVLPPKGSGNCVLCIYADKPFAEDACLDLAYPRLSAIDDRAKSGTDRFAPAVVLKPRIVPVDPILSEVKAESAKFTFLFPGDVIDGAERFVLNARLDGDAEKTGTFDSAHQTSVDFGKIAPGRHELAVAVVGEKSGRKVAENSYSVSTLVTADNATPTRRLNNFVTEIWTKPLANGRYDFVLEKAGWVYVVLDRPYPTVVADVDDLRDALRYRFREPSETQRYLKAGRHVVTVRGVSGEAAKGTISLRLVKTITVSGYKHIIDPSGDYPRWGYSLDYYRLFSLFGTCNTVEVDQKRLASPRATPVTHEFSDRGVKVLSPGGPAFAASCRDSVETMIAAVSKNPAYALNHPMAIDENSINVSPLKKYCYSEAAWQLGRVNEEIHVWLADGFWTLFNRPLVDTMEVSAIVNSGAARASMFAEAYYRTPRDEAGQAVLEDWIRLQLKTLRDCVPSAPSRYVYALSGWEFPGCFTTRGRPDVDLKAFYARILQMLATDPAFADIGGTGIATPICDEDLFRFSFALFRHYCLEGRTDDFAASLGLRLFPGHLRNGDFDGGFEGWTIEPAAKDSISAVAKPGFAKRHEKRILDSGSGDAGRNYAVMTICSDRPNRIRQKLTGLQPGNLYQITFVSVDGADLDVAGSSKKMRASVFCRVEGADEIRDLDHVVRMCGKGNEFRAGCAGIFVHRRVFRATAATADLVLEDWDGQVGPAWEVGSRVAVHYVGCDGFFARDSIDLDNLRALNRENNMRWR